MKRGPCEFTPFWMRGTARGIEREEGFAQLTAPLVGIMPAPRHVSRSTAESLMDTYAAAHRSQGARTQEQAERSDLRRSIIRDMRLGRTAEAQAKLQAAISQGKLSQSDRAYIHKESRLNPLVAEFEGLRLDEALKVWDVATSEERKALLPILRKKGQNLRSIPPEDQPAIRARVQRVLSEAA